MRLHNLLPWILGLAWRQYDGGSSELAPHDTGHAVQQFNIVTCVLQEPMPIPTVTVTVGVVATPIESVHAALSILRTAEPQLRPSVVDDTYLTSFTAQPYHTYYHDEILAFWRWLNNASFVVTPFRLVVVTFVAGYLLSFFHLLYMIRLKKFEAAHTALKTLYRGVCSGSRVFWTLFFSLAMYLCYDKLEHEPMNLVFSELILWAHGAPAPVAKFSRKMLLWCAHIWNLEEIPKKPELVIFYQGFFKDVHALQKTRGFKPRSLSDIAVALLCDCYRGWQFFWCLVSQALTLGLPVVSSFAMWGLLSIKKLAIYLVLQLARLLICLFRVMEIWVAEKEITFESLCQSLQRSFILILKKLNIFDKISVWVFMHTLLPVYVFFQVKFWTGIQKSLGRLDEKYKFALLDLACSYDHQMALAKAVSMRPAAVAELILKKNEDLAKQDKRVEEACRNLDQQYGEFIKLTGTRAVEWRATVIYLCHLVNWHRSLMDTFMNIQMNDMHGLDPTGSHAIRAFRSSTLSASEPLKNGLHINVFESWSAHPVPPEVLHEYEENMRELLRDNNKLLNRGQRIPKAHFPLFPIPYMDLFSNDATNLDMHFPQYDSFTKTFGIVPQPLDPSKFEVPRASVGSIEDYASKGDVEGYFKNLPAHLKKQRELAHPFMTGGLRY